MNWGWWPRSKPSIFPRRFDPVKLIKQVQAAGLKFVDYTGLFLRPDDELRFEVGRRTVRGNTDRFTILFQKPMR